MKKLIFLLLLSVFSTGIYAQVHKTHGSNPEYADGNSYGYYVDEVPGAVSYTWTVLGSVGPIIFPAHWDAAIDIIFTSPGWCDVVCTIKMADGSEIIRATYFYVDEAPEE